MFAGCQSYHAKPLDDSEIDAALTMPSPESLCMRASAIHHPLLPDVEIHPEQGLTAEDAAIVAVIANPALRAARDLAGSTRAAVLQAGLLPNPHVSYSYAWVTGGNTAGAVNASGLGLDYDVTSLIAHDANVRAAQATSESVDLSIAWQEWQTAEAARLAVYDLLSLQAQLQIAKEIDGRLTENARVLQQAVDKHLKTTVDLSAAQVAAEDAHTALLQSTRDVEHQRLQLNRALGAPANVQIKLRADESLPSRFDLPLAEEILGSLYSRRLDLIALRSGYQSQEQALRAAVLNQFPKINLGFTHESDNSDVHMAGLAVSIDLPIFDRNQGVIAQEKATRQRLFDEFISRVFEARSDIAEALADVESINSQIADAKAAIPILQHLVADYKEATDHGNADVLSYYAALTSLDQKNLDVLKLQQQLADARIALELASGRYFPDAMPTTVTEAIR